MSQGICFWDSGKLASLYGENNAFIEIDEGKEKVISYRQLHQLVIEAKKEIAGYDQHKNRKLLIMLVAHNSLDTVVYYLAALQLKHVVWWVDNSYSTDRLQQLQKKYAVNLLIKRGEIEQLNRDPLQIDDDLGVLITTSGSTGSASLVKLSYQNINSNCDAICKALELDETDMVSTTLPLHYSFGLSVLNTHLRVGSCIALTETSLMDRDFWNMIKSHPIKCLYGVPYTFDMLMKLSLARLPLGSLRFMAVAGGKLSADKVLQVNDYCIANNKRFYVMYGQTEASARITVLAPQLTAVKPFSIGKKIAGKLWLEDGQGRIIEESEKRGELCYQGDNVMMGLAQTVHDLSLPSQISVLRTGDLAVVDNEGDYQIVGRLKRFVKVVGHRINLDEVEHFFNDKKHQVACTGIDDMIFCYLLSKDENMITECRTLLSEHLSIHSNYNQWLTIDAFPYLSSGKLDYQKLDSYRRNGKSQ